MNMRAPWNCLPPLSYPNSWAVSSASPTPPHPTPLLLSPCSYEGRCSLPSNFDATYCNALGQAAGCLVAAGQTGLMATVSSERGTPALRIMHPSAAGALSPLHTNVHAWSLPVGDPLLGHPAALLSMQPTPAPCDTSSSMPPADLHCPVAEWSVGGTPLLSMMHLERRSGRCVHGWRGWRGWQGHQVHASSAHPPAELPAALPLSCVLCSAKPVIKNALPGLHSALLQPVCVPPLCSIIQALPFPPAPCCSDKPVIKKALVELDGAPMQARRRWRGSSSSTASSADSGRAAGAAAPAVGPTLAQNFQHTVGIQFHLASCHTHSRQAYTSRRAEWAAGDCFRSPGPIQVRVAGCAWGGAQQWPDVVCRGSPARL